MNRFLLTAREVGHSLLWAAFFLVCVAVVCYLLGPARGDDATARRARVALALAKAPDPGCGVCRGDLDECREESAKSGKPIVLFVGGCDGRAKELPAGEVITCRAKEYTGDGRPAGEKRILVIGPKAKEPGLWIWKTLPPEAKATEITEAASKAKGQAPVRIDWDI